MPHRVELLFRQGQRKYAVGNFGLKRVGIEAVAQSETQLIIELRSFEVKSLPIDADEMGFACGDNQVGASQRDLDTGGTDSRHVDDDLHGVGLLETVVVGIPKLYA